MRDNIIIYYGEQCSKNCNCDYCLNKERMNISLQKFGYQVSIQPFSCDWNYYYPARLYFDYAIRYHNKILGSLRFKTDKFSNKIIEFVKIYFDYIICASKNLEEAWINNGIETKYLLSPNYGLDTIISNIDKPIKNPYPGKFKFQIAGDW